MAVTEIPPGGSTSSSTSASNIANAAASEMTVQDSLKAILAVLNIISLKLSLGLNLPENDSQYSSDPTLLNNSN